MKICLKNYRYTEKLNRTGYNAQLRPCYIFHKINLSKNKVYVIYFTKLRLFFVSNLISIKSKKLCSAAEKPTEL